jgi:hypothetical protein
VIVFELDLIPVFLEKRMLFEGHDKVFEEKWRF